MTPVIRIDDEVWEQLQKRAKPLIDTPNDVLRRILELDVTMSSEVENMVMVKDNEVEQEARKMSDSIFIVVNAAGEVADDKNANDGCHLTKQRVSSGVDILARRRFGSARKLRRGARIVMHQGGAVRYRQYYPGAGQLVAAGRIRETARELTEKDKQDYRKDLELVQECYPGKRLVGIIFYQFPKGMAKQRLPKEEVSYQPGRGVNLIEIKPNDPRYAILDSWWNANS